MYFFVVVQSLVMFNSLQPHGLQQTRLPCPSLSPGVCSDLCSLSWWCCLNISSSATLFFCLQSFPAQGCFPMSQLFTSAQSIRSLSFSISPFNEYSRLISFRIDWFDLLAVQGTLKSLLQHCSSKPSILWGSAFFMVQISHPYKNIGKTIVFDYTDFCQQSGVFAF